MSALLAMSGYGLSACFALMALHKAAYGEIL